MPQFPDRVDELEDLVFRLRMALRQATLQTSRVSRRCIKSDSAGSSYEMDWRPEVKEWAALAELDLSKHDPMYYDRR